MTRVKRGCVAKRRRDRIKRVTVGCKRALSRLTRSVQQQAIKTLVYSHRDRNRRKRAFRHLWIVRLNAAARIRGVSYSELIDKLYQSDVLVNRKMLAQTARFDPQAWHIILSSITMTPHTERSPLKQGNDPICYLNKPYKTLYLTPYCPEPNQSAADQDQDQDQADVNSTKLHDVRDARHGWRHKPDWTSAYGQIACHYKQQIHDDWLHNYLHDYLNQADTALV